MTQTTNIASQVKAVNQLLEAGEPANISVDTYSGFTGYKPQFIVDAMNEVFGWGGWGFEEISNEIAEGETAKLIISQVKVFLKDIAFQPTGWGQARITKGDIGDARKGAQTDAIKKALSYFSIGNRAYQGLLVKEDTTSTKNTHQSQKTTQQNGHTEKSSDKAISDMTARAKSRAIQARIVHNLTEWQALLEHLQIKEIKSVADIGKINEYLSSVEQHKEANGK